MGDLGKRVSALLCALWIGLSCSPSAGAETGTDDDSGSRLHRRLDRASDFAPVGVLLDHTHARGDWTFLYRYARLERRDLLVGDQPVTVSEMLARYPEVPVSWVRSIHTFGVMYAPRDRFTFALLLPVVRNELAEWTGGTLRERDTTGIGDAKLMFLVPFMNKGLEKTQLNFGISFPTGSIQQKEPSTAQRLPYVMQLGSGSWDAIWGITYTGQHEAISWGGQFESQYRIATNGVGYKLGTVYTASAWVAGGFGRWLSASGRFAWTKRGNIKGQDFTLDKTVTPLNDNKLQGGTTLEVGPGVNVLLPFWGGQRLSVEALFPIYEDLDGPQLATDVTITAGWQWIF